MSALQVLAQVFDTAIVIQQRIVNVEQKNGFSSALGHGPNVHGLCWIATGVFCQRRVCSYFEPVEPECRINTPVPN